MLKYMLKLVSVSVLIGVLVFSVSYLQTPMANDVVEIERYNILQDQLEMCLEGQERLRDMIESMREKKNLKTEEERDREQWERAERWRERNERWRNESERR